MAKKDTAVAVQDSPGALTEVLGISPEELLQDQGLGKQHVKTEDMAIPFLAILQALSPQVNKREGEYIEGAEQGMIFNSVTKRVYSGEKGILVVPCEYQRRFVQWWPRESKGGQGLVKDWGQDTSWQSMTKRDDKGKDMFPDGTHLVTSGMHYVLLIDEDTGTFEQAVLSLSSTQFKKSNRWNTLVSLYQAPHPLEKGKTFNPARFYCAYRLKTVPEDNESGSWYGWDITNEGPTLTLPNGKDIYLAGRAFCEAINKGLVKTPTAEQMAAQDDTGADNIPY